jgi:carboxyl-terminal processing protease
MRRLATWRPPLWVVAALMALTLALGSGVGYVRGAENSTGTCTESEQVCAKFRDFWEVWNLAEARFVDKKAIQPDAMIAGAINGMLDSLGDQGHTRYLTADQNQRFQEALKGSFEGIGAFVDSQGGLPTIVAPIEGSPAEKAGIRAGDTILRVDGKSTEGLTLDEVVSRIKGPKGTQVKLQVRHSGEESPVDLTITRAEVTVPIVTWRMLPGKVADIRLSQFADNADQAMRKALDEAKAQGAKALIIDLRDNPGGRLDQAISVTSLFVPKGKPVLLEAQRDGSTKTYRSDESKPYLDLPMVILINGGTASAAEIFSGAMQDYDRATLIGVPTAGTGTVLSTIALDDGSELLLGTAQWQTPKGRYLRREGVSPDVTVGLPPGATPVTPSSAKSLGDAQILNSSDIQLRKALSILGAGQSAAAFETAVVPR